MSDGLEDMGTMQWHLVLSNFVAWLIVVASLIKGVKSLGKVCVSYPSNTFLLNDLEEPGV